MTAAQRAAIAAPATGLLVYQTDGITGLYQYNGTAWVPLDAVAIRTVTASTTLLATDQVVLCSAGLGPAILMTLPAASASNAGWTMTIKRINVGGGTCTVTGVAAVDGLAIALAAPTAGGANNNSISVVSDGTNWYAVTRSR